MNYQQVLQARLNRKTRSSRPFANFWESFLPCDEAASAVLQGRVAPEFQVLLERSAVISVVSAVEVYYRDILDYLFRYCEYSFFEEKLKVLHPEKYYIHDLINIHRHQIHPLELVSSAQSFQSTERIDRVFSLFVDGGFWNSVLGQQVFFGAEPPDPMNSDKSNIATWTAEDFTGLKNIFLLRHEIVHDPARRSIMTEEVHTWLGQAASMIFGSDLVLGRMLTANKRPEAIDEAKKI